LLSLVGLILLVAKAALEGNILNVVCFAVYGVTMVALYAASTLYHAVPCSVKGRMALRKLDHTSIYLLIAGSYTPICLAVLGGGWGWSLFGVVWALAIGGSVLAFTWIMAPRQLTATLYLVLGWVVILAIYPLWHAMSRAAFLWLLLGGICYTVGGVLYALKWPGRNNPRFGCHEIFHVFVVLGSLCHWIMMMQI
jgi:hemolysin III